MSILFTEVLHSNYLWFSDVSREYRNEVFWCLQGAWKETDMKWFNWQSKWQLVIQKKKSLLKQRCIAFLFRLDNYFTLFFVERKLCHRSGLAIIWFPQLWVTVRLHKPADRSNYVYKKYFMIMVYKCTYNVW